MAHHQLALTLVLHHLDMTHENCKQIADIMDLNNVTIFAHQVCLLLQNEAANIFIKFVNKQLIWLTFFGRSNQKRQQQGNDWCVTILFALSPYHSLSRFCILQNLVKNLCQTSESITPQIQFVVPNAKGDTLNSLVILFHQELVLCMHEIWKTKKKLHHSKMRYRVLHLKYYESVIL